MKNAMKKLMSLVLVAMILVSALPFAASAAGYDVCVDGTPIGVRESISYEEALAMSGIDTSVYNVTAIYKVHGEPAEIPFAAGQTLNINDIGNIVYIWFETEEKTTTPPPAPAPAPTAYPMSIDVDGKMVVLTDRVSITYEEVLEMTGLKASDVDYIVYEGSAVSGTQFLDAGYVINLAGETRIFVFTEKKTTTEPTTPSAPSTGSTGYSKLSGDIILEICMDKNQTPTKSPSIKSSIALDGKVTLDEVKSIVKQYFNSVDTDTGIVYDGLYVKQTYAGNVVEWVNDDKVSTVEGLYDAANNSKLVTIRVYISNAKLASSGNADPTNPKTGDTIMMPVAVMTVSACALAVAFYLNKKRAF